MLIETKTVCAHCGKEKNKHQASTFQCPKGRAHRIVGHTWFGPEVFEPKEIKLRKKIEIFEL